jgi:hypothetical protein
MEARMNSTKIKTLVIFALLIFLTALVYGKQVAVLDDVSQPQYLAIDDNYLYISENHTVYIYSLKDYSLVTSFGKAGEGPREFKLQKPVTIPLVVDAQTENLVITCLGKVSFFTKKGQFLKEHRITDIPMSAMVQPVGKRFARARLFNDGSTTVTSILICDADMKILKEAYKQPYYFQQGKQMNPLGRPLLFATDMTTDHLMVDTGNGPVHVFDSEGKKKFTIQPKTEKIPFTAGHKKEILNFYKTDPRVKQYWDYLKNIIRFPQHFPPVFVAIPANGNVYLLTFRRKNGKGEYLIYDKTGAFVKQTFVPTSYISVMEPYPMIIKDKKLYQLVENEDDEEWQLHINAIE